MAVLWFPLDSKHESWKLNLVCFGKPHALLLCIGHFVFQVPTLFIQPSFTDFHMHVVLLTHHSSTPSLIPGNFSFSASSTTPREADLARLDPYFFFLSETILATPCIEF